MKPFLIQEMYRCQCVILKGNKHHNFICDKLFDYRQPHQHVHLKGKKYYSVLIQECSLRKETSTY